MERNENGFSVRWSERGGQRDGSCRNMGERSPERDFACPGTGELWQGETESGSGCNDNSSCARGCSNQQLSMVYAPKQCWRMIFSPADAMRHGTMFEELYKPLEGYGNE